MSESGMTGTAFIGSLSYSRGMTSLINRTSDLAGGADTSITFGKNSSGIISLYYMYPEEQDYLLHVKYNGHRVDRVEYQYIILE